MSTEWYLYKNGTQYGPYTWENLYGFAREGRVHPDDNIWCSGMAGWVAAGHIEGLLPGRLSVHQGEGKSDPALHVERGEALMGIIPALQRKIKLLKFKTYTLAVTDRRLIFAELTGEMLKEAAAEAIEESKGKGFFTRMKETATSQQRVYSRYKEMRPEDIIAETPGNFAVNNNEIKTVRIRTGHYIDEHGQYDNDTMLIHTTREKINLTFNYSGATPEAKKILWRALGKKVK